MSLYEGGSGPLSGCLFLSLSHPRLTRNKGLSVKFCSNSHGDALVGYSESDSKIMLNASFSKRKIYKMDIKKLKYGTQNEIDFFWRSKYCAGRLNTGQYQEQGLKRSRVG